MNHVFRSAYSLYQKTQQASQDAGTAQSQAASAVTRIEQMQADIERLLMIVQALWEIIKENELVDDEELMRKIQDIDMRDGVLDGRVAKTANPQCPHCRRTLIGRHPFCLYCGQAVLRNPFER